MGRLALLLLPGGSFTRPLAAMAGDTFHADHADHGPPGLIAFRFA